MFWKVISLMLSSVSTSRLGAGGGKFGRMGAGLRPGWLQAMGKSDATVRIAAMRR